MPCLDYGTGMMATFHTLGFSLKQHTTISSSVWMYPYRVWSNLADICQLPQRPEELLCRVVEPIRESPAAPLGTVPPDANNQVRPREVIKHDNMVHGESLRPTGEAGEGRLVGT